jgi:hypothetical protein
MSHTSFRVLRFVSGTYTKVVSAEEDNLVSKHVTR